MNAMVPLYVLTAFFAAVFVIGPFCVFKFKHKGIIRCCIMLTAFCLWIFWATVYISQLNPLIGPRLDYATLAWMAYKWGDDPTKI